MGGFRLEAKRMALKGIEEFREYRKRSRNRSRFSGGNPVPFREFDVAKPRGACNVVYITLSYTPVGGVEGG